MPRACVDQRSFADQAVTARELASTWDRQTAEAPPTGIDLDFSAFDVLADAVVERPVGFVRAS